MKTEQANKTIRKQMKMLTDKYGPIAAKAGAKLWQLAFEFWPSDNEMNTQWTCTMGIEGRTSLCWQGYGNTPHKAFTEALDKFKRGNPARTKEG